jgi:transcription antitermination protein NusB
LAHDRGARARHLARELLVKALYQWQIAGHGVAEISSQFAALADFERCDRDFFGQLLAVTIDDAAALDALIARLASRGIEQLDPVGRAVLLLGMAELAKRYGTTDSFKFVNAVLDKMARELRPSVAPGGAA